MRSSRIVWLVAGVACAAILLAIAPPFLRALRCTQEWASGEVHEARVVPGDPALGLVLALPSGESCTIALSAEAIVSYAADDPVRVVARADRPGTCEFQSTVEASEALLVALGAAVSALCLLIGLIALGMSRMLSEVPELTTRFDGEPVPCPRCEKPMEEGYLPLQAGVPWRRTGEPVGLVSVFQGLPGTVSGLRSRPRVHAFRCEPCEVVTFRYGR